MPFPLLLLLRPSIGKFALEFVICGVARAKSVLDPTNSSAQVLRLGFVLVCVWASLRWGDSLWVPPAPSWALPSVLKPLSVECLGVCWRTGSLVPAPPAGHCVSCRASTRLSLTPWRFNPIVSLTSCRPFCQAPRTARLSLNRGIASVLFLGSGPAVSTLEPAFA